MLPSSLFIKLKEIAKIHELSNKRYDLFGTFPNEVYGSPNKRREEYIIENKTEDFFLIKLTNKKWIQPKVLFAISRSRLPTEVAN